MRDSHSPFYLIGFEHASGFADHQLMTVMMMMAFSSSSSARMCHSSGAQTGPMFSC